MNFANDSFGGPRSKPTFGGGNSDFGRDDLSDFGSHMSSDGNRYGRP